MSKIPSAPAQPVPLGYAAPPPTKLLTIAARQKAIIWCILGYFALVPAALFMPRAVANLLLLGIGLTGAVFVFMLAVALYGAIAGIALGVGTLIPIAGLFVLLGINQRATRLLRDHGIRVGLMGADLRQLRQAHR